MLVHSLFICATFYGHSQKDVQHEQSMEDEIHYSRKKNRFEKERDLEVLQAGFEHCGCTVIYHTVISTVNRRHDKL